MRGQNMLGSGRQKIFTNYTEVNADNVIAILNEAYPIFSQNVSEINYLINYYKGIQPILEREKKIRPDHNAKIVSNLAYSIVQFKTGYLLDKPIQYVARKEEVNDESIIALNDYMVVENKESKDKTLANLKEICGTAYRLVMPNRKYMANDVDSSPFILNNISPKQAFIVYTSDIGEKPLLGCIVLTEKDEAGNDVITLQAYSKDTFYKFVYGTTALVEQTPHTYGDIPLVEYPNNNDRIGSFELVMSLLNAVNLIESDRVNATTQFVQSLMVFKNIEISADMLKDLQEMGAINITDNGEVEAKIEFLQQELNQEQVQKLKDDMIDIIKSIVGMPSNKSGSVGNSQGAVIMRDGWSETEAKALDDELMFKESEREVLKLAMRYMKTLSLGKYSLKSADIEIKFTRRNYENLYQKAQVLTMMLAQPKIAPRLAFVVCGLFADPEESWKESEAYYEANKVDSNATTE